MKKEFMTPKMELLTMQGEILCDNFTESQTANIDVEIDELMLAPMNLQGVINTSPTSDGGSGETT